MPTEQAVYKCLFSKNQHKKQPTFDEAVLVHNENKLILYDSNYLINKQSSKLLDSALVSKQYTITPETDFLVNNTTVFVSQESLNSAVQQHNTNNVPTTKTVYNLVLQHKPVAMPKFTSPMQATQTNKQQRVVGLKRLRSDTAQHSTVQTNVNYNNNKRMNQVDISANVQPQHNNTFDDTVDPFSSKPTTNHVLQQEIDAMLFNTGVQKPITAINKISVQNVPAIDKTNDNRSSRFNKHNTKSALQSYKTPITTQPHTSPIHTIQTVQCTKQSNTITDTDKLFDKTGTPPPMDSLLDLLDSSSSSTNKSIDLTTHHRHTDTTPAKQCLNSKFTAASELTTANTASNLSSSNRQPLTPLHTSTVSNNTAIPAKPNNTPVPQKSNSTQFVAPRQTQNEQKYPPLNQPLLYFLPPSHFIQCAQKNKPPYNTYPAVNNINDRFNNIDEYVRIYRSAICEQMYIELCRTVTQPFAAVHNSIQHNKLYDLDNDFTSLYRNKSIHFYDWSNCTLQRSKKLDTKNNNDTDSEKQYRTSYHITINHTREKSTAYNQHDLWILSNNPDFDTKCIHRTHVVQHGKRKANNNDVLHGSWISMMQSEWHAPSKTSNMLELIHIPIAGVALNDKIIQYQQPVYAIRGPNFSTEFQMLEILNEIDLHTCPLLPYILNATTASYDTINDYYTHNKINDKLFQHDKNNKIMKSITIRPLLFNSIVWTDDVVTPERDRILSEFKLNIDQRNVLQACCGWIDCSTQPVTLVHGVYGSGKSYLLVSIIIFFSRILDILDPDKQIKILICCLTNVAVDNILLGLLKYNYTDLTRVGSVKKIAKPILPYTLNCVENAKTQKERDTRFYNDLQQRLHEDDMETEFDTDINAEQLLNDLSRPKQRTKKLLNARVFGSTVAATQFEVLQDTVFPIVFIDECSQMIEPMSLIPIVKFHAERILCVGDPNQLKPQLLVDVQHSVNDVNSMNDIKSMNDTDYIDKTLFVRLSNCGLKPIVLHTQYRCHPLLSQISNHLFYDNKLSDGISATDRPAVLIDNSDVNKSIALPALVWIDVLNGREQQAGYGQNIPADAYGSHYNEQEVTAVYEIVRQLLQKGVLPSSIGIITLYKAQMYKIRQKLDSIQLTSNASIHNNTSTLSPVKYTMKISEHSNIENESSSKRKSARTAAMMIQVSTVDAFQGGERDIIILSCSRTTSSGFLDSANRINVAITRARNHLLIVGHSKNLQSYIIWKRITQQTYKTPKSYCPNIDVFTKLISNMHGNTEFCTNMKTVKIVKPVVRDNNVKDKFDVVDEGEIDLLDAVHDDVEIMEESEHRTVDYSDTEQQELKESMLESDMEQHEIVTIDNDIHIDDCNTVQHTTIDPDDQPIANILNNHNEGQSESYQCNGRQNQ